jgi:hypothetical protein
VWVHNGKEAIVGKLFLRVVPTCAAVAVIGAAFAATGASGFPQKCFLGVEMTRSEGSYSLRVHNPTGAHCLVGKHPRLRLLGENGEDLPTDIVKVGERGSVVIPPGGTASARLRFSADVPGPGEPTQGPCEPKATEIRVFGPAGRIGPVRPPTSVCDHGKIEESVLS